MAVAAAGSAFCGKRFPERSGGPSTGRIRDLPGSCPLGWRIASRSGYPGIAFLLTW